MIIYAYKETISTQYFSSLVPNVLYECLFNRFQELGLSMQACLSLDSKWEDTVRRSLPSGTRYVKVCTILYSNSLNHICGILVQIKKIKQKIKKDLNNYIRGSNILCKIL